MNVSINKDKYIILRKKLDDMKIFYSFDITNYNLIETLVEKIESLKDKHKLNEYRFEKNQSEYDKNTTYVKSLESEIDKLTLENSGLHQKLMTFKNKNLKSIEAKELEISRLTTEKNELKLLNVNYSHKIEAVEYELDLVKKKLSSVLTKIYDNNLGETSLRKMFEKEIKLKPITLNSKEKQETTSLVQDYNMTVPKGKITMNYTIIDSSSEVNDNNKMFDSIKNTFNKIKLEKGTSKNLNKEKEEYEEIIKLQQQKIAKLTKEIDNMSINNKDENTYRQQEPLTSGLHSKSAIGADISDKKSDLIIDYLKKEKELLECKHKIQLNHLLDENSNLKQINEKMKAKITLRAKQIGRVEKEENIKKKEKKNEEILISENNLLKKTVIELSSEVKILKSRIAYFEENFIEKEKVIYNEKKQKDLENDLRNSYQIVTVLQDKLKESGSNNNSEKIVLNNNMIDLKNEIVSLNKKLKDLSTEINNLKNENDRICNDYNYQVSINMRQQSIIDNYENQINN